MKDSKELLRKMGDCVDLRVFIPQARYAMENIHVFHDKIKDLEIYLSLHEKKNPNLFEKVRKVGLKAKLYKFFKSLEIPPQEVAVGLLRAIDCPFLFCFYYF